MPTSRPCSHCTPGGRREGEGEGEGGGRRGEGKREGRGLGEREGERESVSSSDVKEMSSEPDISHRYGGT